MFAVREDVSSLKIIIFLVRRAMRGIKSHSENMLCQLGVRRGDYLYITTPWYYYDS